jgi:YbbR domain-containing protein
MADFFRRYVLHNLGLKLMSLALAVGLWFVVASDPVAEVAVDVPIEFLHVPTSLEIISESIPQAQIRVRGPERIVRSLRPSDVHAELEMASAKPGEHTFDLTAQQVRHPHDLDVVQVVPNQLRLTVDTRLTRQVEIHPRVIGTFASGYQISRIVADPPVIAISGPEQRVKQVEAAITDPVDASGTMQRAVFVTRAYVSDPMVQVINPGPVRVTVIMEKAPAGSGGH